MSVPRQVFSTARPAQDTRSSMPREDAGSRSYLMPLVNVVHASAVTRSTGPAAWSLVSRMAMRPGELATSTHCPPLPPLYDDFRQFSLVKFSPDGLH